MDYKWLFAALLLSLSAPLGAFASPKKLTVTSSAFLNGNSIPLAYACTQDGGQNQMPSLRWSKVPAGTKAIAIFVSDPDGGSDGLGSFYHLGLYGISSTVKSLPSGYLPKGSVKAALNDFGQKNYIGPCPPPGETHHYHFVVYALKQTIKPRSSKRADNFDIALETLAAKAALGKGTLIGLFAGIDSSGGIGESQCLNSGLSWNCTTTSGVQSCQCQ